MTSHDPSTEGADDPYRLDEDAALRSVVEGTASETGERFFRSLVDNLRRALGTMGAWVATVDEERGGSSVPSSMKMRERWLDGFTYRVEGTPCERALEERRALHVPDRLVELYRDNPSRTSAR